MRKKSSLFLVFALILVAVPQLAYAAEEPTAKSVAAALDNVWTLLAAFLVFFMQAGFAMVEAGFTRAKNASNIIMKNLMDFSLGSLIFWAVGFAIMFGSDLAGLVGTSGWFMLDDFKHLELTVPLMTFLIFQTVFAATAATIVSGAMAERTKFAAYLTYSIVISALIYPVVGHWIWGGGWLSKMGFVDFAGSTVVHSVGGWAALVGAYLIGPRRGKYGKDGRVNVIPGHNITIGALGVFILWFGWFGFNPGSTLSGTTDTIGMIAVTTNLAAAAGATMTMIFTWIRYKKPDVSLTLNGALAGLVAITAGCASVTPVGAIVIGLLGGITVVSAVEFFDRIARIDDPVGAISVHGICGAMGTIAVGFLANEGGLFYGGGAELLVTQLTGVAAVFGWTVVTAFVMFSLIKATIGLRVDQVEEENGLDIGEHGSEAYADFAPRIISTSSWVR